MAQSITPTVLPAPTLSDKDGNGIVKNRDVIVEGEDIEDGAISNVLENAYAPDKIFDPVETPSQGRVLAEDNIDISELVKPAIISVNVWADFDSFDSSLADNDASKRLTCRVVWRGGGNYPGWGGGSPLRLVYDDDTGLYTGYTGQLLLSITQGAPPPELWFQLVENPTYLGYRLRTVVFQYTGVKS